MMSWWLPLAAFVVALGGTFWLQKKYFGPQDCPNARSLHIKPVPRTGGLAIVFAVTAAFFMSDFNEKGVLIGLVITLAVISFLDDIYDLHAVIRLGVHLITAAIAMVTFTPEVGGWGFVALLIALSWMTNLYNFMDGSDGLAAGMAVIGFSCYASAALLSGNSTFAALNLAVAAAALAFLLFNFHPARIFLGDVGSIPLGFLAGILGLLGWQYALWPAWFPPMVFSPFIVDATLTLTKRLLQRQKIWQAHSEHYYQKLVHSGLGQRKIALFAYILMNLVAITSLIGLQLTPHEQTLFVALWGCLYLALIFGLEKYLRNFHAHPAPPPI